jgi:hypothetical protein
MTNENGTPQKSPHPNDDCYCLIICVVEYDKMFSRRVSQRNDAEFRRKKLNLKNKIIYT